MYERIMVPLDGSGFSEQALLLAQRLAQRSGAELHLVSVTEPSGPTAAEFTEYLERISTRIGEGSTTKITTAVRAGPVSERLAEEVEASRADLTVMATHGRGGLSRAWLGSVATGFLHVTTLPLMLVRPEANQPGDEVVHWGFAKILVPVDGTELSELVMSHAVEFGGMFGAAYHLVRVVSPPVDVGSPYMPPSADVSHSLLESAQVRATAYLDELAELLREGGLTVTTSVIVEPQAGQGILEAAELEGCDSIAMATHGRIGLKRALLGSAADKVLRGATVPVLLYRPDEVSPRDAATGST